MNHYETNLDKNDANFVPLTPLSFLERAKDIYPNYEALVYESRSYTWTEVYKRCTKFASALEKIGIGEGDTVSVMAFNTPEIFEAHYSVPMTGAVLNTINSRVDAKTVAYILEHSEAKVLIVDRQLHSIIDKALNQIKSKPIIIDIQDNFADQSLLKKIGDKEYEDFLNSGNDNYIWKRPKDEWQAISLSYTSGTTGNPKGVVYHHRGASLLAQGNVVTTSIPKHAVYLWTLPMFHCNGWCFPWTLSVVTGTHICIREVRTEVIWTAIKNHSVTHLCGAPIVMSIILSADESIKQKLTKKIEFFTAAAPPSESVLADMDKSGFNVTHLYGLTEVYGPAVANDWHLNWNELTLARQASLKARQGVRYHALEGLEVFDVDTMEPVPRDGTTIGEVMLRGNVVMKGYLKNKLASEEAFRGGWFHSGDIGEFDEDGLLRITDRKKSLIVTSGGKNVAPQPMEVSLTSNKYIEQCNVVGDDRNFISALIVPNKENLLAWADEKGLSGLDYNALCAHELSYDLFDAIVKDTMTNFSRYESVRKFTLIADEWTVDRGELTPKMSIKRKVVIEKHKAEIEEMYNSPNIPVKSSDDELQLGG